jgi:uncharacterized RDD family membrane protein YckC
VSLAARRPRAPTGTAPRPATAAAPAPGAAAAPRQYVGLVTRTLAFGVDAALIDAVALLVGGTVALSFSVLTVPQHVRTVAVAVGGAVYVLWTVGYFVTFWATTGQTPGARLLGIRVVASSGGTIRPRRAVLRFAGLTLAVIPLFAGILWILVDDRRRGLQDLVARTVVVEAG